MHTHLAVLRERLAELAGTVLALEAFSQRNVF